MESIVMISPKTMETLCCCDDDDKSLCLDRRRRCLVIDCRPFISFNSGHIAGAVNVHCPPILKRRSRGNIQLQNVICSDEVRSEVMNGQYDVAVFYDDQTMDSDQLPPDSVIMMAIKVVQETQRIPEIYLLQGGYETFSQCCGHLCRTAGQLPNCAISSVPTILVTRSPTVASPDLVRSTKKLTLDGTHFTTSGICTTLSPPGVNSGPECGDICRRESSTPQNSTRFRPLQDLGDPVFILPWLYLGNSYHASQDERLVQLGMTAKLNVAGQQSSPSYSESRDFRCMSIPVADTSTENISSWFPKANEFIEQTRHSQGKVLVHCQAGISRSATICIAYLMYHNGLSLDQAYDFIQTRRSVISPNMNFMRQLVEYEKQLQSTTEPKQTNNSSSPSPLSICSSSSSSSSASTNRRAPAASLSAIISRLHRPCRSYELTAVARSSSSVTACSSSSYLPYSGRHSSPSVFAVSASPYPDQKHGKTARRHRRSSLDLGLQLPAALSWTVASGPQGLCRMTSASMAFELIPWPQKHDDDVFPCAPETSGFSFPFSHSPPSLSPLLQST